MIKRFTVEEMLQAAEKEIYLNANYLNVAYLITYWNDISDGDEYILSSYKAVTRRAYEILRPHFKKNIGLYMRSSRTDT